jgi:hypothetical protein
VPWDGHVMQIHVIDLAIDAGDLYCLQLHPLFLAVLLIHRSHLTD